MDITTATTTTTASIKTPEAETETPTRIQPIKPLSFTNGVLKRHHPQHHNHHHPHHLTTPPVVVTYKECLKNHAASLGGHAVDGCGEFMPSPSATSIDPTSLKCAACGCHRNFHRREPEETTHVIEFQPHHRHQPPPPRGRSPSSPSPPPISSSYYPSAPHMLLALSAGLSGPPENPPAINATPTATTTTGMNPNGRKRFRTKFNPAQKEKMYEFAERVGWKMQKRDEELVSEFCNDVGVDKGVFKVWMHNNKNTLGKRDVNGSTNSLDHNNNNDNNIINDDDNNNNNEQNPNHNNNDSSANVATNGSSSSS